MDNIKEIIKSVIGKMAQQPDPEGKLEEAWAAFVGEKSDKHAHFTGVKDKKIYITVDSPARLHQYKSKKSALLRNFKKIDPEIIDVVYRVGQM